MMQGRARNRGYTLIELLVVMTIIVVMIGIALPTMIRGGFFSSDKTRTSARDLFAQLRAASVQARTKNTEVALAYDVTLVKDSLLQGAEGARTVRGIVPTDYTDFYPEVTNGVWDDERPVLTHTLLVRRLTTNELKQTDADDVSLAQRIINHDVNDEYASWGSIDDNRPFVPANTTFGQFEELPVETSVLINHPSILTMTGTDADIITFQDRTALQTIAVFYVSEEEDIFVVDRAYPKVRDMDLTDTTYESRGLPDPFNTGIWNNRFPAHVFKTSGALDNPSTLGRQRIALSIGMLPDAPFYDRYMVDEDNGDALYINEFFYGAGEKSPDEDLVPIDTDVTIYVPTGRIVVEGDDGT